MTTKEKISQFVDFLFKTETSELGAACTVLGIYLIMVALESFIFIPCHLYLANLFINLLGLPAGWIFVEMVYEIKDDWDYYKKMVDSKESKENEIDRYIKGE